MKRRDFLKYTAALSPLMINGVSLRAFASPNLADCAEVQQRTLVVVQMRGANDGLNTFIPVDQYGTYANIRPNIAISDTGQNKYIDLDNTLSNSQKTGVHPTMTGLKSLYDQGKVNIVQGVGYPDFNRSHFKSTDLWFTGGDGTVANSNISTGWMGRYLDDNFPNVQGLPTTNMPDPLAIELGDNKPSIGFHTETEHRTSVNLTGQDPAGYYTLVSEVGGALLGNVPNSHYGDLLQHVMSVETGMSAYAQRITHVFNQGTNFTTYPDSELGNQLKTVARLISGGCQTKIFLVKISGFDTHNAQAVAGSPETGTHADLLNQISTSISAFQNDIGALGVEDQVLTVTFSEFGRKPIENGNNGTDHGTWAPMMLFGKHVNPGVLGNHNDLSTLDSQGIYTDSANYDYRQVFTSILQDWLGANDSTLTATMFDPFISSKLPIIDPNRVADVDCYGTSISTQDENTQIQGLTVYPNPTASYFNLRLHSQKTYDASIHIMDLSGRILQTEHIQILKGQNEETVMVDSLSRGHYIIKLISNEQQIGQVFKLVKI